MKILHTSDWHIGNFPGPEQDGKNLRAVDNANCIQHLYNTARNEEPPDIILIAGDLFHQARVWADRGLSEVQIAIEAIQALGAICPIVVMRGTPNHDGSEQFEMFRAAFSGDAERVFIVTEPKVIRIKNNDGTIAAIAALPGFDRGVYRAKFPGLSKEEENITFTDELGKIVHALKAECGDADTHVLMSHYTVPGCNLESGQTQFFSQFEPVILPEVLDGAGFDLVCLGHIHRPQQIKTCQNVFYAGALNAMNFNDEGQERGFWMHELHGHGNVHSAFYETPARGFLTLRMDDQDIQHFNNDNSLISYSPPSEVGIEGKIVRVIYNCTEETNKALNRALLEKALYEHGAFWVSEVSPEQITVGTNKNELSELMNPETNLISYLREKGETEERIAEVVEAARPIIAEALSGAITTRLTGVFTPLEIEVKNYRNYAEEAFDFRNINFCTINGKNGSGKSSLFMDAILDCLYEEPREGDLTGWIRADEKARSGFIAFTFAIGEKTFRVTRTRAKSGKATLNLSELLDGEWTNRSHERIKDTQNDIVNILGMDSMTFRSCALIMQDQYGLFLQADKEDRMAILGNILGLGIYGDMEQLSRIRATDAGREMAKRKTITETLSRNIADEESLNKQLTTARQNAEQLTSEKKELESTRDEVNAEINRRNESAQRAEALRLDIKALNEKAIDFKANEETQEAVITAANAILDQEAEIKKQAAQYGVLLEDRSQLLQELAGLDVQIAACADVQKEVDRIEREIAALTSEKMTVTERISDCKSRLAKENELRTAAEEYAKASKLLCALDYKSSEYVTLSDQFMVARGDYTAEKAKFDMDAKAKKEKIESLTSKVAMLTSSGCPTPETASCSFLADAKAAADELPKYRTECTEWKTAELERIEKIKESVTALEQKRNALGYDPGAHQQQRIIVQNLEKGVREYEQLSAVREKSTLLRERLTAIGVSLSTLEERLVQVKGKAEDGKKLLQRKTDLVQMRNTIDEQLPKAAEWVEKEKQIPLAGERKASAETRLGELQRDLAAVLHEISQKEQALTAEQTNADATELKAKLDTVNTSLSENEHKAATIQMDVGRISQRLEDIGKKKEEIAVVQTEISVFAAKAAIFDTLKTAFSQDGIPHNIIRAVLPTLSATANNILGQMTGGKMGIDFITDKILKSNSKKEVPTLDIVIEEYGKDTLPYKSKSGGEKVKASLSVILALAETKSSQAGIQLGMLFIDEPPFLDADGVGAYCDALETIQRRYSNLKVMAITHDPAMKARFPQSIDIIKTENGSRVESA